MESDSKYLIQRGFIKLRNNDYEGARYLFEKAGADYPDGMQYYHHIALTYEFSGNYYGFHGEHVGKWILHGRGVSYVIGVFEIKNREIWGFYNDADTNRQIYENHLSVEQIINALQRIIFLMSKKRYAIFQIQTDAQKVVAGTIAELRRALDSDSKNPTWYTVEIGDDGKSIMDRIEGIDLLGWALSLKDDDGKNLIWISPRPGITNGRIGLSFLELAALVRGNEYCNEFKSTISKRFLISSITAEKKSLERFHIDREPKDCPNIIRLPFRVSGGYTIEIPFYLPRVIAGLKYQGEESIKQSGFYVKKDCLIQWGLLDIQEQPTQRAKALVDAVESWLLYEYSLVRGIEAMDDEIPNPLKAVYLIETNKNPTRLELASALDVSPSEIDEKLEAFSHRMGIDRWMWKDDRFFSLDSPEGEPFIKIDNRISLWMYLRPGTVCPYHVIHQWDPVPGVSRRIFEKWENPYAQHTTMIIGPLGSGKTCLLGTLALTWMNMGKSVATLNTGKKVPDQPNDPDLLIIVDDLDRLNINYLSNLLSSWQNPEGARLIVTMRRETHEFVIGEARKRRLLPTSDEWRTVEIPPWNEQEIDEVINQFIHYFNIPTNYIQYCLKLCHKNDVPALITSYLKQINRGIKPTIRMPPGPMQLKFLRLMADIFVEDSVEPTWKNTGAKSIFQTYCCIHLSRCFAPKIVIENLIDHFWDRSEKRPIFPYGILRYYDFAQFYWIPHWYSPFGMPVVMLNDEPKTKDTVIDIALVTLHNNEFVSAYEFRRLLFILEEFKKMTSKESMNNFYSIIRDITKNLLEEATPDDPIWLWPVEMLHGMPDTAFSSFNLYPERTWSPDGIEKWFVPLPDEKKKNILSRFVQLADSMRESYRIETSLPVLEAAVNMAIYSPPSSLAWALAAFDRLIAAYRGNDEYEKAIRLIDYTLSVIKKGPSDKIQLSALPCFYVLRGMTLLDIGRVIEAEAWLRNALIEANSHPEDIEIQVQLCSAWIGIARSLQLQKRYNEALEAILTGEGYLQNNPIIDGNLPGMISRTKEDLYEILGDKVKANQSRSEAVDKYARSGDYTCALSAMNRALKEARVKGDKYEEQRIQEEMDSMTGEIRGSKLFGSSTKEYQLYQKYARAKKINDVEGVITALENILQNTDIPFEALIELGIEYASLKSERGMDYEAADALIKILNAGRENKNYYLEMLVLRDLVKYLSRSRKKEEAIKALVDLTILYMSLAPSFTERNAEMVGILLKGIDTQKLDSYRGSIVKKKDGWYIVPKQKQPKFTPSVELNICGV